ncbi:MAG: hypothetical protein QOI66_3470, partial [Myxococcales bacterium]|nr:hypothetical protein [Myxococcales bacterium]
MDEVAHSLARAGESTSASGAPQTSIELSNDVSGAKVSAAALPGLPVRLKHIFSRGWWPAALVGAGCAVLGIVGVLWFGTGPRRSVALSVISAPTESDRPLPSPQQQQPPPAPAPVPTVIAPLADLAAADASVDRSGAAAAPAGAQALPSSRARAPSAGTRPPARREPGRRPAHKVEMDGLVDL